MPVVHLEWKIENSYICFKGLCYVCVGDCLLDQPQKPLSLPDNLPGSTYSLHRQCELAFGPGSKPCPYMHPCSKLWCTGKARGQLVCQTRHFPWADGTSCGTSKICYRGANLFFFGSRWMDTGGSGVPLAIVHGAVMEVYSWPRESVTTQSLKMEANTVTDFGSNIAPATSILVLIQVQQSLWFRLLYKNRKQYDSAVSWWTCWCDYFPCAGKSFREEQCEAFNGFNLNTNRLGSSVVWVPKYSGISPKDKCKLICRANGTGYFYVLAPKVLYVVILQKLSLPWLARMTTWYFTLTKAYYCQRCLRSPNTTVHYLLSVPYTVHCILQQS